MTNGARAHLGNKQRVTSQRTKEPKCASSCWGPAPGCLATDPTPPHLPDALKATLHRKSPQRPLTPGAR